MEKIYWNKDYVLGYDEIDSQHMKLFEIIGTFYNLLEGDEAVYASNRSSIINELVDYTKYHFETEEKLFLQYNYPAAELHMSQHRTFTSEVARQVENIIIADIEHGKEFYNFLVTWLLSHIAKADRAFCNEVKFLSGESISDIDD